MMYVVLKKKTNHCKIETCFFWLKSPVLQDISLMFVLRFNLKPKLYHILSSYAPLTYQILCPIDFGTCDLRLAPKIGAMYQDV